MYVRAQSCEDLLFGLIKAFLVEEFDVPHF